MPAVPFVSEYALSRSVDALKSIGWTLTDQNLSVHGWKAVLIVDPKGAPFLLVAPVLFR